MGKPLIQEPTDIIGLMLFVMVGGILVGLCHRMRQAQQQAEIAMEAQRAARHREHAARIEAEEANRLKDQFLARVSHDLRTPLQAILGWAHILRHAPNSLEDRTAALDTIERSARAQCRLVDDLLDMSRIAAGRIPLLPRVVRPEKLVDDAVKTVAIAAQARRIKVVTSCDGAGSQLWADPDRLQQVMWNLLSNAIKFSPEGSTVQVMLQRKEGGILLQVIDEGAGIDPGFLPFVFEPFRQADPGVKRRCDGLGLGLSITRHLVELHGGRIKVESEGKGLGTRVTVWLPLAAPVDPLGSPAGVGGLQAGGGVRVLVVDDDAAACELIARILRESDFDVVAVGSVDQAISVLPEFDPAIVVSDIAMPERDGYELIRHLRGRGSRLPSAPQAIALTALTSPEDRRRVLREGFRLHLAKPVEPDTLTAAVVELSRRPPK